MTSNMIYIVALVVGFKCPRKIYLNTQCPPPLKKFKPQVLKLIMNVPKYIDKQLKVFQRCSLGILSVNCFAALWHGSRQDFFGKAEIINAIKPFFTVL